jgi:hypothetical protein
MVINYSGIEYRGIFFVRCYKNLKKNSRVIYPNMTVNYPEILTLEKEGFLIFLMDKLSEAIFQ